MDHAAIAELAGAYALGAVTADEGRAVEDHIAVCAECGAVVTEMRAAVQVLPYSCEIVDPSPGLKRRILDVASSDIGAEERLRRNLYDAGSVSGLRLHRDGMASARNWVAAAAALALIAAGFAIGSMQAHSTVANRIAEMQATAAMTQAQLAAQRAANAAIAADAKNVHGVVADVAHGKVWDLHGGQGPHRWHCMLVQPPNKKNATLIASIPAAPHGMKFQAWIIHKGTMHRAPVLPAGVAMVEMPMPLEAGDVVAFSMEPPQGSAHPTSRLVMEQTL